MTAWNRMFAVLGRVSMYRVVFLALASLAVISLGMSVIRWISPLPWEILASLAVLALLCAGVDVVAQRILEIPWRVESSLITAMILLFVLRPSTVPLELVGTALAAGVASLSKYLLAWRGRHVFNPAAVGASVLTAVSIFAPALGSPSWWVGTPVLAAPVLILGVVVLLRTEKVRVIVLFLVIAMIVGITRTVIQYAAAGVQAPAGEILGALMWSSPFLFLGAFMLSEPLTLPPRRWQQYIVAGVVGVLAGWPIALGAMTLGQERALLIGNLVAFAFTMRTGVALALVSRARLTPTVQELTFHAKDRLVFRPGQFLELDVPHHKPDARGTRREFSIASAPEDLPVLRLAFKDGVGASSQSSYKRALAEVPTGGVLAVTGVWGDFLLPASPTAPVLMVAAGIGVTPFVSQLRHLVARSDRRDIVVIYVAGSSEELAYRDDLATPNIPVWVYTPDQPPALPEYWRWSGGARLDAHELLREVPDIASRHAYVSGPPRLIASLAPALGQARSLTTDAFSGY